MTDKKVLQKEINQYHTEKESVREILGQTGGSTGKRKETAINITFGVLVLLFFSFDVMRHAAY